MIMAMMKNTGMLWIGQIPVDWELGKVKYAFNRKKEKSTEKDPTVLSLARAGVKIRDISTNEGQLASSYEGYNPVEPNDLLLNPMDLVSGANCSISKVSGVISPAYVNLREKTGFEPRYYDYYFKTQYWNMGFFVHGKGVSFENRWTLNDATLKDYYIPMPSLSEQQAIADYLDETCSKIDEIIAEAKASIDEYKELKQSVIFEAVTKGLDKNVEMKQCSVNWLDEIPSTWESIRLKYLLTEINNRSETGTEQPLSVSQVMGVVPSYMIAVANPTASYVGQKIVEPNDIVFNKLKAHLGVFFMSKYHGLVSPDYAVYRTNDKVIPKYLEYLFHTSACISEFKKYISGVAEGLMRLYTSDLFNIRICLPKVDEQIKIVEYVENKVELFDSLIAEKESLINDLESYKKSLIYEVVTGKRRVV